MRRVWIGMTHVRPNSGCTIIDQNAYVQVLAFVNDADEFQQEMQTAAEHYSMTLMGIEDLEPFDDRLRTHSVAKELKQKAEEAKSNRSLRFGTFNTYPAE